MSNMFEEMNKDWHVLPPSSQTKPQLFSRLMLEFPFGDYVVKFVKDPLRKSIIKAKSISGILGALKDSAKRIPAELTRENCTQQNTLALFDIEDKFFEYDRIDSRKDLFHAAFKIFKSEIEHDGDYRNRYGWLIEETIKAILDGKWVARNEGKPDKHLWKEPEPYGGKYSIIYKMQQNREEIKKLLEV